MVDDSEDLGARAVVLGEREHAAALGAALPEDLDIGVAEAVDRLELVPHEEELLGVERVDELALEPVRVLELVHEHGAEAPPGLLAHLLAGEEEVAGVELEVLEVDARFARLRLAVGLVEAAQELLEELAVARGHLVERGALDRVERLLQPGERLDLLRRAQIAEVEQLVGARRRSDRERQRPFGLRVPRERLGALGQRGQGLGDARLVRDTQLERTAGRAQALVDAAEHDREPPGAVGREQLEPVGLAAGAEARERLGERLRTQDSRLALVQYAEPGIEPRLERMRLEEPVAEAVDGRDPGALDVAREIDAVELQQSLADPGSQLPRGALGVGDDEDALEPQPAVGDRADEALDEDGGLPGAGAGRDEDDARLVDRGLLLRIRGPDAHARFTRHIGQRSHHVGQVPPRGSCSTSPARMRATAACARSTARSTCAQNSVSSR